MRVHRNFKTIFALASLAAFAGCASSGRQPRGSTEIIVSWDSGPLDRDYGRVHSDMVSRHNREIEHPRSDESIDVRNSRQASERQDLELRYSRGKSAHSRSLPPSER